MALMLAAYVTMWAQDVQRLVVWQKTGEKVYIDLAEQLFRLFFQLFVHPKCYVDFLHDPTSSPI